MAETDWIFESTDERIEYQEIEGGVRQEREVQIFVRVKVYTDGSAPASLSSGDSAASVSADNGAVTISSTGSYVCTSDGIVGNSNIPAGIMTRRQIWENQGDWTDL